jgi:hypothetical protein
VQEEEEGEGEQQE